MALYSWNLFICLILPVREEEIPSQECISCLSPNLWANFAIPWLVAVWYNSSLCLCLHMDFSGLFFSWSLCLKSHSLFSYEESSHWIQGPLSPEWSYHQILTGIVAVVQSLSHVWLSATPWTAACQASLTCTISRSLFKLVHWVGDAIKPSHSLSSPSPLALTLCDPMDCSMPGFPVPDQLPELAWTHIHWDGDAI